MSKRRSARIIAVQCCYANLLADSWQNMQVLKNGVLSMQLDETNQEKKYDTDFLDFLIGCIEDNNVNYQDIIKKFLNPNWSLQRLDLTKLAILQCAICELKYCKKVDAVVIINEYVTVSRLFLQGKDIDFVNAILEKIANHLSQGEDKDGFNA